MILQSLVTYYEALAKKDDTISLPGYSVAPVTFGLILREDGTVKNIRSLKYENPDKKDKFLVPRIKVPQQEIRASGIKANFLCDNSAYILGIDSKENPVRSLQCFNASKALHLDILGGADETAAQAVCSFYETWQPEKAVENEIIAPYLTEILAGVNIAFMDEDFRFIHENLFIRNVWEEYRNKGDTRKNRRCLVTGKIAPVAILHGKIKGVRGAQSAGANLVSFNADAYESYGCEKSQGLNAPVSEYVSFAYSTVLNMMLSNNKRTQILGDTTVLWWSEEADEEAEDLYATMQFGSFEDDDQKLNNIMNRLIQGKPIDTGNININGSFCVLGLAPNAARISVRFFYRSSFGRMLENITAHYRRLEITKPPFAKQFLTIYRLLLETVSTKVREPSASPLLAGAMLRSVISGTLYPAALYNAVIIRIRAEGDINCEKAAIIKAFLLKNSKNEKTKEVLTLALNEQNRNSAYVLGRLFAVLEKAQFEANPGIKATIKDRYFTSACATPALVFPNLIKLSVFNTAKAEYGKQTDYKIGTLIDMLEGKPIPKRLTLEEQGLFIIGYYHEVQHRFTGKVKTESETNNLNEINESEENGNV